MSDFSVTIQMILVIFLIASAIGVSVTRKLFMAVIVFRGIAPLWQLCGFFWNLPTWLSQRRLLAQGLIRTVLPDAEEGSRTERHKGGVMR